MAKPLKKNNDDFYTQAVLLAAVVKRLLKRKSDNDLSEKPTYELKSITEFMKRMRVTSLGKFEGRTYISTVNFYENDEKFEANKPLGAVILHLPEEHAVKLLGSLGYPVYDENEESVLEDACGTFCNLIAGSFKSGLIELGYKELKMSHFSSYQNEIINGVAFNPEQKQYYEIGFVIDGQKRMIIDLTLARVPREGEISDFYF